MTTTVLFFKLGGPACVLGGSNYAANSKATHFRAGYATVPADKPWSVTPLKTTAVLNSVLIQQTINCNNHLHPKPSIILFEFQLILSTTAAMTAIAESLLLQTIMKPS
eukprot:GHRR01018073.1.p1 GENE.GHRR01018073.1~~GHRR01018073.1.p1  ORF type:complete len:108 (+),score=26.85 GHRR01018073.1:361-684(+)